MIAKAGRIEEPSDPSKTIRLACEGAAALPLSEFEDFQGDLKWLETTQYEKLKAAMLLDGFHDPIQVWRKPGEAKPRKVLDGHQRVATLRKMIAEEGFALENDFALPVVWIEAETEKQAKRIVLQKMSEYGRYDYDSVYKFAVEAELDWPELKSFADFAALNMGTLDKGWFDASFSGGDAEEFEKIKEGEGEHECPRCGFSW